MKVLEVPVSGIERLLEVTRQAGLKQLEAILACTFTFDAGYFEQFLEGLAELDPDGMDHLRSIPIDVVCDHRHYRGHGAGYNVHCWQGDNLFHPKLLLLLFADRLVWLEGSLNMTRAGYVLNRELVSLHESRKDRLPPGIDALVERLKQHGHAAAERVWQATRRGRVQVANRSVTSLSGSLLTGLMSRVKKASDVYVVAPFFDRREQAGPSIETSTLRVLADQYPEAKFWIYLPEVVTGDGTRALQASRGTFSQAFGPQARMGRLVFCGVPSDRHPLHAKLLALRYGRSDATVTALVGSPNLTEAALVREGNEANVEVAREFTMKWSRFEPLILPLGSRFKKLADCRFEPPVLDASTGWHALESAVYDPLGQELRLAWRRPEFEESTRICYAGSPLKVAPGGTCDGFAIRDGELRLETICRKDPKRRSWCPIVIPVESRLALGELPDQGDLPPEWWLAQLGSLASSASTRFTSVRRGPGVTVRVTEAYELGVRVRELASRMRYVSEVLTSSDPSDETRIEAHLRLLEKIFNAHDPSTADEPAERTWRLWVRLELAQTLASAAKASSSRRARKLARAFRGRLEEAVVPPEMRERWQALAGVVP